MKSLNFTKNNDFKCPANHRGLPILFNEQGQVSILGYWAGDLSYRDKEVVLSSENIPSTAAVYHTRCHVYTKHAHCRDVDCSQSLAATL